MPLIVQEAQSGVDVVISVIEQGDVGPAQAGLLLVLDDAEELIGRSGLEQVVGGEARA